MAAPHWARVATMAVLLDQQAEVKALATALTAVGKQVRWGVVVVGLPAHSQRRQRLPRDMWPRTAA